MPGSLKMSREWAMPNASTFEMVPISAFIRRWISQHDIVVDPFARNSTYGSITNDLNPDTKAEHHMEAAKFCEMLADMGVEADAVLFDPPYSPRQVSEVYQGIGIDCGMEDTQTARMYRRVRTGLDRLLKPGGVALSFGWNSAGFGEKRGYVIEEILLVAHGGAHNDTICVAERKLQGNLL